MADATSIAYVPVSDRRPMGAEPPRMESRVRLRVQFNRIGCGHILPPPFECLTPDVNVTNGALIAPRDGRAVDVLVYASDVPAWTAQVEANAETYKLAERQYEAALKTHIQARTGKHPSEISLDRATWDEETVLAEGSFPGHPFKYFFDMERRGVMPLASVEVLETNVPPPQSPAERAQEIHGAQIARAIKDALGGSASPDVERLAGMVASLTAQVDSLKAQLGIPSDAPKSGKQK